LEFVPPPHTEIVECLADFEECTSNDETDTPDLVKVAILHYQFETIHPFVSGNGCIGRMIIPLYLQSKGLLDKSCLYISNYLEKNKNTYYEFLYLYHVLQSIDNVPEIKYIFAYLSKTTGFTNPLEFKFDETAQFILESIIFTAMNLYNNGGAVKSKLAASHERFVKEIENNKEESLSRTQQLNTIKIQALRELGYNQINEQNAAEIFEKIAEIQSRKV